MFLKDHRALGWFLLGWLIFQLVRLGMHSVAWSHAPGQGLEALMWVEALVGALLILALVQHEPTTEGDAFWRTRPLTASKLLFVKSTMVLLYGIVIPSLLHGVFLWLAGFRGDYFLLGLCEWLPYQSVWVVAAFALAAVASRPAGYLFVAGIALFLVLLGWLVGNFLRAEFGLHETRYVATIPREWLFLLTILVFGIAVILSQYLSGSKRKLRWLLFSAGAILFAVSLLPLPDTQWARNLARVSESDTNPPEVVICPFPRANVGTDVYRFVRTVGDTSLEVWPRGGRVRFDEGGVLETQQPLHLLLEKKPAQLEWQQALGLISAPNLATFSVSSLYLLNVDEDVKQRHVGKVGTLETELVSVDFETKVLARLPLRKGARKRNGPLVCEVRSCDFRKSELSIMVVTHQPDRDWVFNWPGIGPVDGIRYVLIHKPTNSWISNHSGGYTRFKPHPSILTYHHRLGFDLEKHFSPVMRHYCRSEVFNLDEWEIACVYKTARSATRFPFRQPHFQVLRTLPNTVDELEERLEKIVVDRKASKEVREAVLWHVWACWNHEFENLNRSKEERIQQLFLDKVREIDPPLEMTLKVTQRLALDHPFDRTPFKIMRRFLSSKVTEKDRDLVLGYHDVRCDLMEIIDQRGWQDAAFPLMLRRSRGEIVPFSWADIAMKRASDYPELFAPIYHRFYNNYLDILSDDEVFDRLHNLSGFPLKALIDDILRRAITEPGHHFTEALCRALAVGHDQALSYSLITLSDIKLHSGDKEEILSVLGSVSNCPPSDERALEWLQRNHESAVFNDEAGMYETKEGGDE